MRRSSSPTRLPKFLPSARHTFVVEAPDVGRRLDAFLAARLPEISRTRLQGLIASRYVTLRSGSGRPASAAAGGRRLRPSDRLRAGDHVDVEIPPVPSAAAELRPERIPLAVIYEDDDLLVVDKPAGMTVHPGAGRSSGTLVHALLARYPDLPRIGGADRPGIVHRLDKDTSGLLVVAKTEAAWRSLQTQIQSRRARRGYLALVHGRLARPSGVIDAAIGRDRRHRTRMAVVASGRRAVTNYRVAERFDAATLLLVDLDTGRTHQIRVHCAHIGHPVVGDPVYGRKPNRWGMRRQALHAHALAFVHPVSGAALAFSAPLPDDIGEALRALRLASGRRGRPAAGGRAPASGDPSGPPGRR
ncbi:MAG: RluA family pseudouridine synthase [bacterium]